MYDYTLLFRLHIQKSQYRLSYLHCYFRFYTKELDILSYSLILLSIFIRNRYSKNTQKKITVTATFFVHTKTMKEMEQTRMSWNMLE